MDAAEGGIARCADGSRHFAGIRGELLGLGGSVSGNSGGAETSDSEDDDESADDVVFHGYFSLGSVDVANFYS